MSSSRAAELCSTVVVATEESGLAGSRPGQDSNHLDAVRTNPGRNDITQDMGILVNLRSHALDFFVSFLLPSQLR